MNDSTVKHIKEKICCVLGPAAPLMKIVRHLRRSVISWKAKGWYMFSRELDMNTKQLLLTPT